MIIHHRPTELPIDISQVTREDMYLISACSPKSLSQMQIRSVSVLPNNSVFSVSVLYSFDPDPSFEADYRSGARVLMSKKCIKICS